MKRIFGIILMTLFWITLFLGTAISVGSIKIAALVWGIAIVLGLWVMGAVSLLTNH